METAGAGSDRILLELGFRPPETQKTEDP
jgi:hypothetical protein